MSGTSDAPNVEAEIAPVVAVIGDAKTERLFHQLEINLWNELHACPWSQASSPMRLDWQLRFNPVRFQVAVLVKQRASLMGLVQQMRLQADGLARAFRDLTLAKVAQGKHQG